MEKEVAIKKIRSFNRFYVDLIGLLQADGYHSNYTLAETRVLFEINEASLIQASQVMLNIHIDKSYLSRILKKLDKDGLIYKERSDQDARAIVLSLTEKGKSEMVKINEAASKLVKVQIATLDETSCKQLVMHMEAIIQLLADKNSNE